MRRLGRVVAAALLLPVASLTAQPEPAAPACPPVPAAVSAQADSGWLALRGGRVDEATRRFAAALQRCPDDPGIRNGAGYAALRAGRVQEARTHFDRALAAAPGDYDAAQGRASVAWRDGDLADAWRRYDAIRRRWPGDSTALAYLARLPEPVDSTRLAPKVVPESLVVGSRVGRRILEVPDGRGGFRPLYMKGVNLGAALPGRFPSEFPADDGTYERWIAAIARVGANTVRVYTIHPPHFYRALASWNRAHPDSVVWLVHGVWTELPPGALEERYDDAEWNAAFRDEMRRVVDLVHGRAAIPPRPGHASGLYQADVSPWTLGWIIGREWEPYSVVEYVRRHPGTVRYDGRYVALPAGNAVEAWMAEACDYLVAYETSAWNAQRAIAWTNWPTLDPLHHPTESSRDEENRLLAARGEVPPEKSVEFDNDAIGLDAARMRAGPANRAGLFASYHAYPYYPDFLVYDPGYLAAQSPEGPSAYFGYLQALVAHHGDQPVVISEYGVPSSRGPAHLQPQGWHHGGHDEAEQGRINARLTRELQHAGTAGGAIFALIDEWFKKNWLVIDFEVPGERNRLWLNLLDAEQNYGLLAMRPGTPDRQIVLDGDRSDWHDAPPLAPVAPGGADGAKSPTAVRALTVRHDEAAVYLRLDVDTIDWARGRYVIGIDTHDPTRGDSRLPRGLGASPVGLEFVLDLAGPDSSRLLVDGPYNPYRAAPVAGTSPRVTQLVYNRPFTSRANADGVYQSVWVAPNRRRIGRDGSVFPERRVERSALRFARSTATTLADWFADPSTGTIEVRLPWGMLNVLDPSSRTVLHGMDRDRMPMGTPTSGFRFVVRAYDPSQPRQTPTAWPRDGRAVSWTWPTWEAPTWHEAVKPTYGALREAFEAVDRLRAPLSGTSGVRAP